MFTLLRSSVEWFHISLLGTLWINCYIIVCHLPLSFNLIKTFQTFLVLVLAFRYPSLLVVAGLSKLK